VVPSWLALLYGLFWTFCNPREIAARAAAGSDVSRPLPEELASATVAVQLAAFAEMVMRNPVNAAILERVPRLALPGCYLAAGALYQTVWNCLTGRAPSAGIKDYDIGYFDAADLSAAGEDAVRHRAAELLDDLGVTLDVRNEARVHLWYEQRFGIPCPPYTSTEADRKSVV